jgi:hypothetical protein
MTTDDQSVTLFDVEELSVDLRRVGRAEAGLARALRQAVDDGVLVELDGGMIGAALIGARALDRAEALPDKSAVYAIAQCLPPYQKALHALRLPAEVAPVAAPSLPSSGSDDAPDWLRDFGTATD